MPRKKTTKETHELTDIETQEVSLVDKAANLRTFLVVKNADGVDVEEEVETIPSTEEAKALLLGEGAVTEKAEEPVVEPGVEAKAEEVVVEAKADEAATVEAVVEEAAKAADEPAPEVVTDEVAKDVQQVEVVANTEPLKIHPHSKKALGAALNVIEERIKSFREMLGASVDDEAKTNVPWEISDALYYLQALVASTSDLCCSMYGAEWEIEASVVSEMAKSFKDKNATAVTKIGRAISGARMQKMKELQGSLSDVTAKFKEIIAEVEAEKPVAEEVGKADGSSTSVTIEEVTALTNQVTELSKSQASDKATIAQLQEELRKSKELLDLPTKPNARRGEDLVNKAADTVVWPSDLASKR